jgi:CRISPR-associated protein Csx10
VSELILTLSQPAQIGDRARKDFVLSTLEHVPGSVVRGAFAAVWLSRHGASRPGTPERKEFLDLFEGGVRFGALLRDGTEFMSLAVTGHKYDPTGDCATVDYDRAMSDEDPPAYCPECESPIEPRRGLHGTRAAPVRRTSVAISESGTAIPGQLFTRELLQPGQVFRGTLAATADQRSALAELGPLRIGGRRTTHGLAEVAIRENGTSPTAQRRPDGDLVIRLRSPGIFTDDYGRPARVPSPAELEAGLGVPARVVKSWTRWEQAGGWHAASGLPKHQELTVSAGSTFVIHLERTVDDSALRKLASRGLGLRRHEGFGDLGPPPALRPGKAERDAETARLRHLSDRTAPLRGLPVRISADGWRAVLHLMRAHTAGDSAATDRLDRSFARNPDASVQRAMAFFVGLPPGDAAYVVQELSR